MSERLRPGDRVCRTSEHYAVARHTGTATVLAVGVDVVIGVPDRGKAAAWDPATVEFVGPGDPVARTCTFGQNGTTGWGEWPGVDGPVLICDTHGFPSYGQAYENDEQRGWCKWHPRNPDERTS